MKRILFILTIATALPTLFYGQSDVDALRYSSLDFGGTARSLGSANAYGALGGDFSSLSINPAGLGIYRSSEFIFTPGLSNTNTTSLYYGSANTDTKYNLNLSNIGFVFNHINPGKEKATDGWVSGSFALGYNKLANYNSSTYYSGFNTSNSLLDAYSDILSSNGGTNPSDAYNKDPFGAGLAWETYLLNPNPGDSTTYYGEINGGNVQQSNAIETEGGYNEFTISFAGNYANRLYIGATIGVPSIHYQYTSSYSEEDVNNVHPNFNSFTLDNIVRTNGIGVNAKVGIIYKINDYVRLGGAIHSPSLFSMTDTYSSSMSSQLDTLGSFSYDSPDGKYDYQMLTPWRVIGSAAFTFKNIGLISFDYEWLDYSEAAFNFNKGTGDQAAETSVNNAIDTKYGTAANIRIGGELMYDVFRFRGGYAIQTSPFNDGVAVGGADNSKHTWTAGLGIKEKSFFIDFAYARTTSKEYTIPYVLADQVNDGASVDKTFNNFLVSFGFRF